MGNLLGSPITTKDTHTGTTLLDSNNSSSQSSSNTDNNGGRGLEYGISSMQGWRVHMEDAHICQPFLYAEKKLDENSSKLRQHGGENDCESAAIEISLKQENRNSSGGGDGLTDNITQVPSSIPPINNKSNNNNKHYYTQIPLPNHSLFAVFDGHGGSFAAEYASRNLLRVLSRQAKFVLYAERWRDREDYLAGVMDSLSGNSSGGGGEVVNDAKDKLEEDGGGNGGTNEDVDKQRLQELKQRGRESDESVKKIKERVRRHLGTTATVSASTEDHSDVDSTNNDATTKASTTSSSKQQTKKEGWWKSPATPTTPQRTTTTSLSHNDTINTPSSSSSTTVNLPTTPQNNTNALQIATAAYDHNLMTLLESSLRDAFCDLDREIYEEVVVSVNGGMRVRDGDEDFGERNSLYGVGYAGVGASVGHLPKSGDGEDSTALSSTASASATDTPQQQQQPPPAPTPPTPTDDEDSGTTASIVLLTPRWIVCANAGDSRAVYSRSNHRVVALSYDHKPDDEEEERRITDAGGYVSAGRVEGDLAVSRGLGDFRFKEEAAVLSGAQGENRDGRGGSVSSSAAAKSNSSSILKPGDQKVSPVPDIIVQNRDMAEDEFIIIACDGIWDVQTNQECVKMVADMFSEGEDDLGLICEEVLDLCLIKGSKDNMTAAVIKFPRQVVGKGGGVMARRERRGAVDDDGEKDEHTTATTATTADDLSRRDEND
eukprot:scaffold1922_cov128-Skeletonema_dohrnii-CCMP3373.AAC.2